MRILNFFLCILTALAGALSIAVFFGCGTSEAWKTAGTTLESWHCVWLSVLNFCLCGALILSVATTLSGSCLTVCGFVFKSWTRAAIAAGCGMVSFLLWAFLLDCTI